MQHPTTVDQYLHIGCGRCANGGTPNCKVHSWVVEIETLRSIALEKGLVEDIKWSIPCYTFNGKNILVIAAFKEYASIGFFKGALINDPENLLIQSSENTNESRHLRFTSVENIAQLAPQVGHFIDQAIEIEKKGLKIPHKKVDEFPLPEELEAFFDNDPAFKSAFERLTPGRQKGYLIHFNGAKQAATRHSRIQKSYQAILAGKGLNDY